jgi:hypothetical protein
LHLDNAGSNMAARMAITTSNSVRVNPWGGTLFLRFRSPVTFTISNYNTSAFAFQVGNSADKTQAPAGRRKMRAIPLP